MESNTGLFWRIVEDRRQIRTVDDVKVLKLKDFSDSRGTLIALESNKQIPFDIKRVFYVYGVQDKNIRGEHAHHETEQVLICMKGECKVVCKDATSSKEYLLNSPTQAIYIPEMIWDEQVYMSEDTVLLVLCNTLYNKLDYIENYDEFKKMRGKHVKNNKNK